MERRGRKKDGLTPLDILAVVVGSLLWLGGGSISGGDGESSGPGSSGVVTICAGSLADCHALHRNTYNCKK